MTHPKFRPLDALRLSSSCWSPWLTSCHVGVSSGSTAWHWVVNTAQVPVLFLVEAGLHCRYQALVAVEVDDAFLHLHLEVLRLRCSLLLQVISVSRPISLSLALLVPFAST